MQINDEIYYYKFDNLIIQSFDISAPRNLLFNGNKVAIRGDQLDVLTEVFTDNQANLNVAYSHAQRRCSRYFGRELPRLQPAYAPDWVIEAAYTHNTPIGSATLRAHIDWSFEGSWFADYVHNKGTEQASSNNGDVGVGQSRPVRLLGPRTRQGHGTGVCCRKPRLN